jgi:hypothetical protein
LTIAGKTRFGWGAAWTSACARRRRSPASPPPFVIHCVYTDVERERRLREVVTGDLTGVLETLFDGVPDGTRVTFNWYVRVTNPVLNLLGYVAERVYRHSHDSVMGKGEEGLRRYCARQASV